MSALTIFMKNAYLEAFLGSCILQFFSVYVMDLREIGWDGGDWIDLAQDKDQWMALVNTVINLRVP
jgi:hypothetical protein